MSVLSGSVNYATPFYNNIENEGFAINNKVFSLHDNSLDGSFKLLGTTCPLWSGIMSDASGLLSGSVQVTKFFRNKCSVNPVDWESGHYSMTTGVKEAATNRIRLKELLPILPSTSYKFLMNDSEVLYTFSFVVRTYDSTGTFVRSIGAVASGGSVALDSTEVFISVAIYEGVGGATDAYLMEQLRTSKIHPVIRMVGDLEPVHSLYLQGDVYSNVYPTTFTWYLYNEATQILALPCSNSAVTWQRLLEATYQATHAVIQITAINKPNYTLRFNNLHTDHTIVRSTTGVVLTSEDSIATEQISKYSAEDIYLRDDRAVHMTNLFVAADALSTEIDGVTVPTNVHTRMKEAVRCVKGKVLVTYQNPLLNAEVSSSSSGGAFQSNLTQVNNGLYGDAAANIATFYDNKLDGSYTLRGSSTEVGWVSNTLADANGDFATPVWVQLNFTARLLNGVTIVGDVGKQVSLTNFTIRLYKADETTEDYVVTGNELVTYANPDIQAEIVGIRVIVSKISKALYPVSISEILINSTVEYADDNLMNVSILEELSYDDNIGALGCVSANELTATFNNQEKYFYFNNADSNIAKQLKRNRRLVPWFGVEIEPGQIEWYRMGTFWSYDWKVPVARLTATVVAFDTIGLLNTITYEDHQVVFNYSVGALLEMVLDSAKLIYDELTYVIDAGLYEIIIPVMWFTNSSYMQALKRIAGGVLMDIFCNGDGAIVCKVRTSEISVVHDVWSDTTNVISKSYPTLYTEAPNQINVAIANVSTTVQNVLSQTIPFVVTSSAVRRYSFTAPVVSNLIITIDMDAGLVYSYTWKSWGIDITFTGTGTVRSISIEANALLVDYNNKVVSREESLITLNGENTVDIQSDMIQDMSRAQTLADSLLSIALEDAYSADVNYRGDIALHVSDNVELLQGIAPTSKYRLYRHTLYWDGILTGTAKLDT